MCDSVLVALTHVDLQEKQDGETVDWLEQVSDEPFRGLLGVAGALVNGEKVGNLACFPSFLAQKRPVMFTCRLRDSIM